MPILLRVSNGSLCELQAYIAFFCFREEESRCTVEFERWEDFCELLVREKPDGVARILRDEGFDCVFGAIDLSIE